MADVLKSTYLRNREVTESRLYTYLVLAIVGIGIAIGIAGAFAMTRLLAAMLFEISTTDVATYTVACGVLAVAALVASIVPARRP